MVEGLEHFKLSAETSSWACAETRGTWTYAETGSRAYAETGSWAYAETGSHGPMRKPVCGLN